MKKRKLLERDDAKKIQSPEQDDITRNQPLERDGSSPRAETAVCSPKIEVVGAVHSPGGAVRCEVGLRAGVAFYRVRYGGRWVVGWSRLGFVTEQGVLGRNLRLVTSFEREWNETWETLWGEERMIRNHYRELELNFWEEKVERVVSRDLEGVEVAEVREGMGVDLTVRVRAFEEGVALRYEIGGGGFVETDSTSSGDFVEMDSTSGGNGANFVETDSTKLAILDELTEFNVDAESAAWWIPAYQPDRYEYNYVHTGVRELGDLTKVEPGPAGMNWDWGGAAQTPLTVVTPEGDYVAIHEAALYDYGSMMVRNVCENREKLAKNVGISQEKPAENGENAQKFVKFSVKNGENQGFFGENTLKAEITPLSNGVRAYVHLPWQTPWRVVMVARNALDLTRNRMILNLNEPPRRDFSWVKPLKFIGIWWGMYVGEWTWAPGERHGATTEHMREYIDSAARLGVGGVLAEGWNNGWEGDWLESGRTADYLTAQADYDLAEVTRYARERGVEVVMHHETVGFIDNYERQIEAAYALCERYGIRYVKSGYANAWMTTAGLERLAGSSGVSIDAGSSGAGRVRREFHHSQIGVRHYQRTVELAARHGICLDIHEPIKGTGIERTWPNLLTREGARGQEYESGALHPSHATIIPFTRMLSGGMDYTSGILDVNNGVRHMNTTLARQLAYLVTIFSGMQMAADRPRVYEEWYPDLAEFIRRVPVSWERTVPLVGEVGKVYVVARLGRGEEVGVGFRGGDFGVSGDFNGDSGGFKGFDGDGDFDETGEFWGEAEDLEAGLAEWRREAGEWFVGGVNNEEARVVEVDLGFLGEGEWRAEVYRDFRGEGGGDLVKSSGETNSGNGDAGGASGEVKLGQVGEGAADFRLGTRERYVIEKIRVRKGEKVGVWMGSGGGFAMRIHR